MRVLVLLAAIALALPASATTMVPLDLPALTKRAEHVVAGRVTQTKASWTEAHDAIYTEVTIHVARVLKGPAKVGQDIVVRREGGSVDGIGMKVYGAPEFETNEDVVVFVEQRGASRYVVGMGQGKLGLYADASGTQKLRRNLSEIAYTRPPSSSERALSTTGLAPHAIVTLDELALEVGKLARTTP